MNTARSRVTNPVVLSSNAKPAARRLWRSTANELTIKHAQYDINRRILLVLSWLCCFVFREKIVTLFRARAAREDGRCTHDDARHSIRSQPFLPLTPHPNNNPGKERHAAFAPYHGALHDEKIPAATVVAVLNRRAAITDTGENKIRHVLVIPQRVTPPAERLTLSP